MRKTKRRQREQSPENEFGKVGFYPLSGTGCQGREHVTSVAWSMKRTRGREMNMSSLWQPRNSPGALTLVPGTFACSEQTGSPGPGPPSPAFHPSSQWPGPGWAFQPSQRIPGPQTLKTPWGSHASAQSGRFYILIVPLDELPSYQSGPFRR